jgi:hypothetical protein
MEKKISNLYLTPPYITFDDSLQTHFLLFEIVDDTIKNLDDISECLREFDCGEPLALYLIQKERID